MSRARRQIYDRELVLNLFAAGHTLREIADRFGANNHGAFGKIVTQARLRGDARALRRGHPHTCRVRLDDITHAALSAAAQARGVDVETLCSSLLIMAAGDDLVDAVLDDKKGKS